MTCQSELSEIEGFGVGGDFSNVPVESLQEWIILNANDDQDSWYIVLSSESNFHCSPGSFLCLGSDCSSLTFLMVELECFEENDYRE